MTPDRLRKNPFFLFLSRSRSNSSWPGRISKFFLCLILCKVKFYKPGSLTGPIGHVVLEIWPFLSGNFGFFGQKSCFFDFSPERFRLAPIVIYHLKAH